MRRQTD
jgi:hypothetical protein